MTYYMFLNVQTVSQVGSLLEFNHVPTQSSSPPARNPHHISSKKKRNPHHRRFWALLVKSRQRFPGPRGVLCIIPKTT